MKKQKNGFTLVELLVVIGILGILMGALFPAISSAMLSAQTNALAMHGRNLFIGITQANVDRESHGRSSVWPKNKNVETGEGDDIAYTPYSSSADEYFEDLFDMKGYGKKEWNPYIDVDIKFVSGAGVGAFKGGDNLKGCIAWKIVTDLTDDMPDVIPVLVSRNISTEQFPKSGNNNTTFDKTPKIDADTQYTQPFGNKATVIIHKGGAAGVYKGRYQSLCDFYDKQTVSFTEGAQIDYLKPSDK